MEDMYKEEFLSKLNWITPKTRKGNSSKDISVSKCKPKEDKNFISFSFRNDVANKITDGSMYIAICFHKNRILFKGAQAGEGYKITKRPNENFCYLQLPVDKTALIFVGDYDLMFDDFLDLYFVEKVVKK